MIINDRIKTKVKVNVGNRIRIIFYKMIFYRRIYSCRFFFFPDFLICYKDYYYKYEVKLYIKFI